MSEGPGGAAREREPVEDSLSALTYESDTENKLKKNAVCKSPKSPKSPYTSSTCFHSKRPGLLRPFKGTEHRHFEISLVKTSRQLWCGSPKQGTRHLGPTKSEIDLSPTLSTMLSGSTPEYLKEALGMKKPKHARSSCSGYIPGTPDYKEKEDMYDEIIELKKTIQAQKCEADRMKTKMRRLEEENSRKDKQIEQLLDLSKGSEFGLLWTEQKNDTSVMINGLKQKILRLEQQCKEKDNTINKLQADEKKIMVKEMGIALQTYYEETQRLQNLLAKSKAVQRKSSSENAQQKAFNTAVLQLSRSIKALQEDNWKLKADLEHMLSSSLASSKAKNYTEWSRQRLVQRISKLEKKMDEMQNERLQPSKTSSSLLLAPWASTQLDQSVAKEPDASEECEHLHRVVKKLKGQRAVLQDQLALKEEAIQKLAEMVKELEQNQGVGTHALEPPDQHHEQDQAARTIQRWWKACKIKNPNLSYGPHLSRTAAESQVEEEAARLIQSVFRAHQARMQMEEKWLISTPGDEKTSPAAFRGEEEKAIWSPFKQSPLVFTAVSMVSAQNEQQPSPLLPMEEVLSDDSDEIITIPPSQAKKVLPVDFKDSALCSGMCS
ncbi:hypothetical protein JRQ81_010300 [Phrynocephalus forsythii]|uniref:IQ domain-containing protein E n=1 Tax=Phrynocephalus forsythii TaxID=171643 RepID=A0A9Q0XBK5_9SAUR|nr:hypothetical protein JRQ81_010300 [Phrynocephalus forsythii]